MSSLRLPNLDAPDAHVSRFELSRHASGEGTPARRAEIDAALASDTTLKKAYDSVVDELRAAEGALKLDVPLPRFLDEHEKRTHSASTTLLGRITALFGGRGLALAGTVAAAAAFMFVVTYEPEQERGRDIPKGALIGFFVLDDHAAHLGSEGEQLRAGDQIQFAVHDDTSRAAMVIVGIDGRGAVTVYDAEQISEQRAKGPNKTRLMKDSVVLDDSTGPERFFAVYGNGSVSSVKAAAESAARQVALTHGDLSSTAKLPLPSSFVQGSVHIVKVGR